MPYPYVIGWYRAFSALNSWRKRDGWRVMWRRRKLWRQAVRKGWYWQTPEERVQKTMEALDALRQIGYELHQQHIESGIVVSSCGLCNPNASSEFEEEYYDDECFDEDGEQIDIEARLKHLMSRGWNINIECKGRGRQYEFTYEATAVPVGKTILDSDFVTLHTVGDSLDELIDNLQREMNVHFERIGGDVPEEYTSMA